MGRFPITLPIKPRSNAPKYSGEYPRLSRGRPGLDSPPRKFFWFADLDKCMESFFFFFNFIPEFNMKGTFDRSYSGIRLYLKFLTNLL